MIKFYVAQALGSFHDDPPDDDYQRGYRAALNEILAEIYREEALPKDD